MNFTKIAKIVSVSFIVSLNATTVKANETVNETFDWDPVMDAITQVESGGNPRAVSGTSCGAMQIKPILVRECNNILSKRGEKKRYSLCDRFDVNKSKEMFVLIMSKYNPTNDIEHAIRLWNGGTRYKLRTTQRYYHKVMAELNARTEAEKDK